MTEQHETNTVRLTAVGDIYFRRTHLERPYNDLDTLLQTADLRFCNYEAPFSDTPRCLPGRAIPLQSPPDNLSLLEAGHFDFISLANNHMLDYGFDALERTLDVFDRKNLAYTGAGRTLTHAMQPVVLEHHGMRFGLLAFACAFPPTYAATAAQPGVAPVRIRASYRPNPLREAEHPGTPPAVTTSVEPGDLAAVTEAVRHLKHRVDHVLVSYHWGVPGRHEPLEYQTALGHATIDAGASVVLGHHAHVLQPVEAYHHGVIFYGMSHFLFDLPNIISRFGFDRETVAVRLDFDRQRIQQAALVPVMMEEKTGPRWPEPDEAKRTVTLLRRLSAPLGTHLAWDATRNAVVVPLSTATPGAGTPMSRRPDY
jgi:poly-gamma-glutamate capsule biosynthesis protein CapA/YwtB (metallophosphatase superfamily)